MIKENLDINRIYYVYEWIRLDTNEPFYVGKGKGNRAYTFYSRNYYFNKMIKELDENNIEYAVSILHDNLTEEEALGIEVYYIHIYDFEYGYDLTNITWGGDGCKVGDFEGITRLPIIHDYSLKGHHKENYEARYARRMRVNESKQKEKEKRKELRIKEVEERKLQGIYETKERKIIERIYHNAELLEVDKGEVDEMLLPLSIIEINDERYEFLESIYNRLKPEFATFGMLGKEQSENQKKKASDANKKPFCVLYSDNKKEVYNSRTEAMKSLSERFPNFVEGHFRQFVLDKNEIKRKLEVSPNYYIIGIFCLKNKKGEELIKLDDIYFDGDLDSLELFGVPLKKKVKVIFPDGRELFFDTIIECKKYMRSEYQMSTFTVDRLLREQKPLNSLPQYYNLYKLNGLCIEEIK